MCPLEHERLFRFSSPVPWSCECQSTLSREVLFLHIPGRHHGRVSARSDETANTLEDILDFLPHHTATALATSAHRGFGVRLDSSQLMRPDVWPRQPTDPSRWTWKLLHCWKWEHGGLITELEMRSALTAIRWRARSASLLRTPFVLFVDKQPSLAVLVKSRSSSRKLNAVARKTAAILLCT